MSGKELCHTVKVACMWRAGTNATDDTGTYIVKATRTGKDCRILCCLQNLVLTSQKGEPGMGAVGWNWMALRAHTLLSILTEKTAHGDRSPSHQALREAGCVVRDMGLLKRGMLGVWAPMIQEQQPGNLGISWRCRCPVGPAELALPETDAGRAAEKACLYLHAVTQFKMKFSGLSQTAT
jgi:hypothetical protein